MKSQLHYINIQLLRIILIMKLWIIIWKSYMWTAEWRIIWRKIITVIYATYAVVKTKPEKKNSGLYGIRTLDLCDTGAFPGFLFATA